MIFLVKRYQLSPPSVSAMLLAIVGFVQAESEEEAVSKLRLVKWEDPTQEVYNLYFFTEKDLAEYEKKHQDKLFRDKLPAYQLSELGEITKPL